MQGTGMTGPVAGIATGTMGSDGLGVSLRSLCEGQAVQRAVAVVLWAFSHIRLLTNRVSQSDFDPGSPSSKWRSGPKRP